LEREWLDFEMASDPTSTLDWKALFRVPGFPFFFFAMFVSLFGTGMNFAGVTWFVLGATHSTVKVSLIVILVTLPGLVVPPFGGVLIDRVDRRYLGIILDATRAVIVLGTAALAYVGRLAMWELYSMVFLLGIGFAVYWSTTNALVQELVPKEQLLTANATVLIAVQGGMTAAGALVGFMYERAGLAGILGIDGTTYLISAICLFLLRDGYYAPHEAHNTRLTSASPTIEAPPEMSEPSLMRTEESMSPESNVFADIVEGLKYLREQPRVLALGITYSCMMAGVISANILVAALAKNPLKRALRLDKIRLAALEAVLRLYADPDRLAQRLPAVRLLARPRDEIATLAQRLLQATTAALDGVASVEIVETSSQIGSGALPVSLLPSAGLALAPTRRGGNAVEALAQALRSLPIPVIGHIDSDRLILDLRCLEDEAAFLTQLNGLQSHRASFETRPARRSSG